MAGVHLFNHRMKADAEELALDHSTTAKSDFRYGDKIVLPRQRQLFYGGQWHASMGKAEIEAYSPIDLASLGSFADANQADVDAAVDAAWQAFPGWRDLDPQQRVRAVRRMAEILRANAKDLALLDCVDTGNPLRAMLVDANWAASLAEFYAGLMTEVKGVSFMTEPNMIDFTMRQPLGVVASMSAFNHPLLNIITQNVPALLTGNTVVVKPSEATSMTALRLAELIEDVFPPGVFNVITGGAGAGAALTDHARTRAITLIGSVPTARKILAGAAEHIKRSLMELGGKNALVAFPDADPKKVAAGVCVGMGFTSTSGQGCTTTSRAFIHESVFDETLEAIVAQAKGLRCGDPTRLETQVGAMSSKQHYSKVLDYIRIGQEEGARLMCGGGSPADPELSAGLYIEPTVFADVTQDMRIAKEEIFGPVLSVMRWSDEDQMIEAVNSVDYGLSGSVWTNDLAAAHRVARRMEVGLMWVNQAAAMTLGAPFGGAKQSGIGYTMCVEQLLQMTQVKNVHIKLRP
jgi:betaine-aldehyde dehydrogenase